MNPDTGAIAKFESDEDAKAAGYTVPLNAAEAETLADMNRKQRLQWLAEHRPEAVIHPPPGAYRREQKALRDARKRQRRNRKGRR